MSDIVSRDALQAHLAGLGYERVLSEQHPGRNRAEHGYVDTFVATNRTAVLAHSDIAGSVDHVRAIRRLNGPPRHAPALAVEDAAGTREAPLSLDQVTDTIDRAQSDRDARQGARPLPGRVADVSLDLPHDHARLHRARVLDDDVSHFDRRATTKYDAAGITVERARRLPAWAQEAIAFADPAERNAALDSQKACRTLAAASSDLPSASNKQSAEASALILNQGMADPRSAEHIASELQDMAGQIPNKDSAAHGGLLRAVDATDAHAAGAVADEVAENSPRANDAQRLEGMIRQWTDERMHGAWTPDTPHAPRSRNASLLAHHENRLTTYSRDLVERLSGTTEAIAMNGSDGQALSKKADAVLRYFNNGQEITQPGAAATTKQPIGAGRADADALTGDLNTRIDSFARRADAYRASKTESQDTPDIGRSTQLRLAAADLHGSARALDARLQDTPGQRPSRPDRTTGPNPLSAVRAWTKPTAALPGSTGAHALSDRVMAPERSGRSRADAASEL